jgi:hypothetical protein
MILFVDLKNCWFKIIQDVELLENLKQVILNQKYHENIFLNDILKELYLVKIEILDMRISQIKL